MKHLRQGTVECFYCGTTIVLSSLSAFADNPAALEELEKQAQPPTLATMFFGMIGKYFELPVAFGAAWSLVATWFVFLRQPGSLPIVWCILAALAALYALAWKRRLAAFALTMAVGGLMMLKPFLRPVLDEVGATSPTSETSMYFLLPGLGLLVLGVIILLTIRPQRFRVDLALLKPNVIPSVGFAAGIALAVWVYTGETGRSLLQRHEAELDALRGRYATIGQAISATPAPPLPERVEGLDPLPRFVVDDDSSNTDFTSYYNLVRSRTSRPVSDYVIGQLSMIFKMIDEHWPWLDWGYEKKFPSRLESALATRYVAVYDCTRKEDLGGDECAIWLADVPSARVLLRITRFIYRQENFFDENGLLQSLQDATGGTFRRTRHE